MKNLFYQFGYTKCKKLEKNNWNDILEQWNYAEERFNRVADKDNTEHRVFCDKWNAIDLSKI